MQYFPSWLHSSKPSQLNTSNGGDFNLPKQVPLSSMPLEDLNALQRENGDHTLTNIANLFRQNRIVILGESHERNQGARYLFHNKDFLCDPDNDVIILTEDHCLGQTTEDILQEAHPIIGALIRDGAQVKGIETSTSAMLMSKYTILFNQFEYVRETGAENLLPALATKLLLLTQQLQLQFGTDEIKVNEHLTKIEQFLASYNGDTAKLNACFNTVQGRIFTIMMSEYNDRNNLQPDFMRAIQSEGKDHKHILVIVGAEHALDSEQHQGLKTLLNESEEGVAEAYCMNEEEEFSHRSNFNGNPSLCLPGNLYPSSKDMTAYSKSFKYEPIPEKKDESCVLF